MKLKVKLGFIFLLGAVVCFFVSYWSVNESFQSQLSQSQNEYVEKSLELGERLVHSRLTELSGLMDQAIETQNVEKHLKAVAMVQFDKVASQWMSRKIVPAAREDLKTYFNEKLLQLPLESVTENNVLVFSVKNNSQQSDFFVAKKIKVNQAQGLQEYIAIAVANSTLFADFSNFTKSHKTEFILANNLGSALAYPEQPYIGQSLQSMTYINEILNSRQLMAVDFNKELGLFVGYKRIANSNLTIVSRSPKFEVVASVGGLSIATYLYFIATVILFLTFFYLIFADGSRESEFILNAISKLSNGNAWVKPNFKFKNYNKQLTELETIATQGLATQSTVESSEVVPAVSEAAMTEKVSHLQAEHQQQMQNLTDGIVQLIKGPMTAVLGQLQVAKTNLAQDETAIEQLNKIENELRESRNYIEGFVQVKEETYSNNKLFLDVVKESLPPSVKIQMNAPDELAGVYYNGPVKSLNQTISHLIRYFDFNLLQDSQKPLKIDFMIKAEKVSVKFLVEGVEFNQKWKDKFLEPQKLFAELSEREKVDLLVLRGLFERSLVSVTFADNSTSLCLTPSSEHVEVNKVAQVEVVQEAKTTELADVHAGVTKEDIQKQVSQAALELKASGLMGDFEPEQKNNELLGLKALSEQNSSVTPDLPSTVAMPIMGGDITPPVPAAISASQLTSSPKASMAYPVVNEAEIQRQLQEEFERSLQVEEDVAPTEDSSLKTDGLSMSQPKASMLNEDTAVDKDAEAKKMLEKMQRTSAVSEGSDGEDDFEDFSFVNTHAVALEEKKPVETNEKNKGEKLIKIRSPKIQR